MLKTQTGHQEFIKSMDLYGDLTKGVVVQDVYGNPNGKICDEGTWQFEVVMYPKEFVMSQLKSVDCVMMCYDSPPNDIIERMVNEVRKARNAEEVVVIAKEFEC